LLTSKVINLVVSVGALFAMLVAKVKRSMRIPDRAARIDKALAPLVAELLGAGVRLNPSRDLHFLNSEDYPLGLPIILAHLAKPYDDLPKSVIATALFYTKNIHAQAVWPEIAELYCNTPNRAKPFDDTPLEIRDSNTKLMLANALLRLYEPKRIDLLIEVVRDRHNGKSRIILLEPLLRVKKRREGMMDILVDLKADPELEVELSARGVG